MVNWCPILIKPKLKVSWAVGGNLSFRMRLHKDSIFWRRPRAWCTTKMVKSNIEDWWQSWTSASSYLENNASKLHDNSDWESCQSKCITILVKFSGWIFQSVYAEKSKKKKGKQEVYNSLLLCLFSLGTQSTVAPRARAPYGFFCPLLFASCWCGEKHCAAAAATGWSSFIAVTQIRCHP